LGDQYWIAGQLAELGFGREARLLRLRPSCACKGTCGSNASPSAIESLKSATNGELPGTSPLSGGNPGLRDRKGTGAQSPHEISAWKAPGFSVWGIRQSLFRIVRGGNLEVVNVFAFGFPLSGQIFPIRRGILPHMSAFLSTSAEHFTPTGPGEWLPPAPYPKRGESHFSRGCRSESDRTEFPCKQGKIKGNLQILRKISQPIFSIALNPGRFERIAQDLVRHTEQGIIRHISGNSIP